MPSPVGHTLFGLGIYVVWCKNLRPWLTQLPLIIWVIICANLPDFDLFIGLVRGNLGKYHQGYTHTLGFAIVVGLTVYLVLKFLKSKNAFNISLLSFFIIFLHIFLDIFNDDSNPPVGVRIFWPFSNQYFNSLPIFYPVPHSQLSDVFSGPFISAIMREIILLLVPLLILVYFKWKKGYEKN